MRFYTLIGLILVGWVGCAFEPSARQAGAGGGDAGPEPDASPPPTTDVRFVRVEASVDELRPGLYGIEVTAVLRNELDVEITGVRASLTFHDDAGSLTDAFRWRDLDMREGVASGQPASIAPGAEAMYRFKVDVLAPAAPAGPVRINGSAAFMADGQALSATPVDAPPGLGFAAINPPIVVNTADDQVNQNNETSFREALLRAQDNPGLDRIVFDSATFPPSAQTVSVLGEQFGELPVLDSAGGDLVIDGSGAGFHLAVDSGWEDPDGRYGLRITGGTVVIHGIGFRDMGYNYLNEGSLDDNNCGGGQPLEGGAIRVDDGTLILDGNRFADPGVAERNCYAASVRLEGGSGHRIVGNVWTDPSMDSLFINTAAIEVSDNVMDAGSSLDKTDECIFVNSQGGGDLWIVGNLCVDQEYSGVIARGTDAGTLYVVHNTFVRNGRSSLSAVRREEGSRAVVLRNNVYVSNNPAAVQVDAEGTGFDLAYEAVMDNPLCASCPGATIDEGSILDRADLQVADSGGTTPADFTPREGSPLAGSALDWLDRNGSSPGRHSEPGPERGAIELP